MPRVGLKALLAIFALNGSRRRRQDRDRLILIASIAVTLGLLAIYLFARANSRW